MVKLWSSVFALLAVISSTHAATTAPPVVRPVTTKPVPAAKPTPAAVPAPVPTKKKTDVPSPAGNKNTTSSAGGKGTNPLVIKGYRFFDEVTGEYVGFRGVNYYPRPNAGPHDANNRDFFHDDFKHMWQRDMPEFEALGSNAIRLYAVDPDKDHDAFMCALQSLGIYVMVDLGADCKGCEITSDQAPACYPASYKTRGENIISTFSKYDNVIGFSGGNEINHRTGGNPPEWNAPCQKKFVRDMRAYIKSCPNMRQIPVGLVMADTSREDNANYYNCRTDPTDELEQAEWYGINVYVHCDDISDPNQAAGFNMLRDSIKGLKYSIPLILTEFGCLSTGFPTVDGIEGQRTFHDGMWMNMKGYSEYFNGGFVFEYSTELANSQSTSPWPFTKYGAQNYGLGYFTPENCDEEDTKCEFVRFPNFHNLAEAYKGTDTSKEPTLESFVPASDRVKPTKCPKHFPNLKDLTWASDAQDSMQCPQVKRLQCPNVPIAPAPKAREAKDEKKDTTSTSGAGEDEVEGSGNGKVKPATPKDDVNEGDEETESGSGEDNKPANNKTVSSKVQSSDVASVRPTTMSLVAAMTALLVSGALVVA